MKLYYVPGACSLSPHIALREAGLNFTLVKVTPASGAHKLDKTADGTDFFEINPIGVVPVLELEDGTRLTEGPAIVQYIADQAPEAGLAPPNGTLQRAQMQSWLNFISTELHKGMAPLFNPATPADYKPMLIDKLYSRLGFVNQQLDGQSYLMEDKFSVADPYLFVVTNWVENMKLDLAQFSNIVTFRNRMAARPAVQDALSAEKG